MRGSSMPTISSWPGVVDVIEVQDRKEARIGAASLQIVAEVDALQLAR